MQHLLADTITAVRNRSRRLTFAHGVSWLLVTALLTSVALAFLDSYLRIEHWASRFLFSIAWALAIEWAVRRYLYPWFRHRSSDLAIAQRIQARYPELKDELATAVEFLLQDEGEEGTGSTSLRRAVVIDATSKLENIDSTDVLDSRPTRKALAFASVAVVVAVVLVAAFPAATGTALSRLAVPWNDAQWPRRNDLTFRDAPQRLAVGSEFEVELVDRNGTLPEKVEIQFRFQEGSSFRVQSESMRRAGDVMVAHRTNVRNDFSYRATGGDDDTMQWQPVEVLEPPRVESLQVTLSPPEYTGWEQETTSGQVRALVGTQMAFQGSSTKPLTKATLHFEDGASVPADIADDGLSFSVSGNDDQLSVQQSGTYWLELLDTQDMASGADKRWRIEAVADEPPSVTIEEPVRDVFVTNAAKVPVRILVKDQLAIRDVQLVYLRGDDSAEGAKKIPLFPEDPADAELESPRSDRGDRIQQDGEGQRELIHYTWDLGGFFEPLSPGALITFHAVASDFRPQIGQSQPSLRIHVVSEDEFQERLSRQYSRIIEELAEKLKEQQQARQQIAELEIQLEHAGDLPQGDLNRLRQTELKQRNIRRALAQENNSLLEQIDAALGDIESNQSDSPELAERLGKLKNLIAEIEASHFPAAEQQLTNAIKESQTHARHQQLNKFENERQQIEGEQPAAIEASDEVAENEPAATEDPADKTSAHPAESSLQQAGKEQDQVIAKIGEALDDLQRWSEYRGFAQDLAGLKREMKELQARTAKEGGPLLGQDPQELNRNGTATLARLHKQQSKLNQRFDNLVEKMKGAADKMVSTDPAAAGPLSDAVHHAREEGISAGMRDAAGNIEKNQITRATGQQQEVAEQIGEMLNRLSSRGEDRLSQRVKKLRKAEKDLANLLERQEGLRKKMEEASQDADPHKQEQELKRLAREQKKLQEEMGRMQRRLQRLRADKAGAKMGQAGEAAGKAGQAGEAGEAAKAGEQAGQAKQDLEAAQKALAKARRQAEMDLAKQILARIEDDITAVQKQQQSLTAETLRLQTLREKEGRLTRGQKTSVIDLSRQQETLAETTEALAEDLAAAEAFALTFKHVARSMRRAAERLSDIKTDRATKRHQESANTRLQRMLDAMAEKKADQEGGGGGGAGDGAGGQPQDGGEGGIRSIAEIRLMRLMQTDLNQRTDELHEEIGEQQPTDEQLEQLGSLAEEQGELAELTFRLIKEAAKGPEDELNEPADEADSDLDNLERAADDLIDAGATGEDVEENEVEEVTP